MGVEVVEDWVTNEGRRERVGLRGWIFESDARRMRWKLGNVALSEVKAR